jgi:hypothetical protein
MMIQYTNEVMPGGRIANMSMEIHKSLHLVMWAQPESAWLSVNIHHD